MTTPPRREVRQLLRDERLADIVVRHLVERGDMRALKGAIERHMAFQNEAVARRLLDHLDDHYDRLRPEDAQLLVEAATVACTNADYWLKTRAWKDLANVHRARGRYDEAAEALAVAASCAARTLARAYHEATVEYARAALAYDTGHTNEALRWLESAIATFDQTCDAGKAYSARLFRVAINYRLGLFAKCAADYEAAAKLALDRGDEVDAACQHANLARCLIRLGDLEEASRRLRSAAAIFARHEQPIRQLQTARVAAAVTIRMIGIDEGLAVMEDVRRGFVELTMHGEAVRCLISAAETTAEVDEDAPQLLALYRAIYTEATKLEIPVLAAEAAERLRVATTSGEVTPELLRDLWQWVDPAAPLLAEEAAN